ncbi:hypothetical protein Srot_1521 [Segniliparus rotundus DSM 44985]|uniref:Uncharacterized protein n=1 Tax=Segniliparus rotundus (strain ATCC BAA-972 / CDC 1076 / CIP 108378 / DSM 44985 / JCM 13578) TaxID=640132 RepID=D6Z7Q4_SEGRD|nr:hypothetical protein [Segniliparus rotundus]ADG97984.1 hypothetical protein Srot_1521 [Segniliparus rotundus DSM 44985]
MTQAAGGSALVARSEHRALVEAHLEDFLGATAMVEEEVRARACAHEMLGFPYGLTNCGCVYCPVNHRACREQRAGRVPPHHDLIHYWRDERGFGAHPMIRTVRRTLEACWDRLALATWAHAEEARTEADRYMTAVRTWAAGEDEWTAFGEAAWFQREETPEDIGLPEWGRPGPWPESSGAWSEPGPEEDPEGKRYFFEDHHARIALIDSGAPGATRNLRERVHKALEITRKQQSEHSGLPLGCHAELVESWYQYLNWMLLSFEHTMDKLTTMLLEHIEEHRHTQTWLLEPKEL